MPAPDSPEAELARSWEDNAPAWTQLVRAGGIESRRLATDAAIIDVIAQRAPARVLDVGCGEGWLARELTRRGSTVVGLDGVAALIEAARDAGGGSEFYHLTYDEFAADPARAGSALFDVVVCNFALLAESLAPLLAACSAVLAEDGALVIQTVHPWRAHGHGYQDGWRTEDFSAFGDRFVSSMPWYFRTFGSWLELLRCAGFVIDALREPLHPQTGEPLSLIIIATHT